MTAAQLPLPFLENASATSATFNWPGGTLFVVADATFGGGSVTVEMRVPTLNGVQWMVLNTFTVKGSWSLRLPPCDIRIGVATATAVYAYGWRI